MSHSSIAAERAHHSSNRAAALASRVGVYATDAEHGWLMVACNGAVSASGIAADFDRLAHEEWDVTRKARLVTLAQEACEVALDFEEEVQRIAEGVLTRSRQALV